MNMGSYSILKHFLALAILFMSTYADNTDAQVTGNFTPQTSPATTIRSAVVENYTDDTYANKSAVLDYNITNEDIESTETDVQPSDEIIISNFNNRQTGHTLKGTLESENGYSSAQTTQKTQKAAPPISRSTLAVLADSNTSSSINIVETATNSASSSTSERNVLVNNLSSVNAQHESTKQERTHSLSFPGATASPVNHVHSSTDRTNKHVDHTVFKHHHIPFRHHLQLVPMDDEPFGAALMKKYDVKGGNNQHPVEGALQESRNRAQSAKDQRYIVSVLIPVGVGIVGAMVIMVTVYGLRHVAKKHGREFPRVDIEAGRQNIASISSERTDKMLLLEDDEDNEF